MKKIIILLIILLATINLGFSYDKKNVSITPKGKILNLSNLQSKGYKIIKNQSFDIQLENWGDVKFISTKKDKYGIDLLNFFLTDNKGTILYSLPKYHGNDVGAFYKIRAISFKDVNNDGLKDIIIISEYTTDAGEEGAVPYPTCSIYFQNGKKFVYIPSLDDKINASNKNENISIILKYLKGKKIGI